MKFSIITACYNRESTLRESIESVLSQDYADVEYIVVDGASTDGSMGIIDEYRDRISRVISEEDGGIYEAINKGIRLSTGDVIGLIHSDDTFFSCDTLSCVAEQMAEQRADIIYGNGLFVDAKDSRRVVRNWISGKFGRGKMRRGWLPLHTTLFIRREVVDQMGLYNENYKISADSDLLVRYMYKGKFRVAYHNRYVVKMRMGGASTNLHRVGEKWGEDIRLYRSHGFNPYWAVVCKILSKIPQFISARWRKTI